MSHSKSNPAASSFARETDEAPTQDATSVKRRRWRDIVLRALLLLFGVGAVVGLVVNVGPARLLAEIVAAAPWLPFVFLLDASWVAVEGLALLAFYGDAGRAIPMRTWLRAVLMHFGTMVILPVGRAGAEVVRASLLAPHVGTAQATAGVAQMQATVLIANAVISAPCYVAAVAYQGWFGSFPLLVAGNALVTLVLGGGLYLATRFRIGGWLGRRFKAMAEHGPEVDAILARQRAFPWRPLFFCVAGRSVQTLLYGVLLLAVGGALTVNSALVSQGIHLVGAGLGDFVPNQVGVTEGAYRVFAPALGLGATPEKALAIAILARVSNFVVAGSCFAAIRLWPAPPVPAGDAPGSSVSKA